MFKTALFDSAINEKRCSVDCLRHRRSKPSKWFRRVRGPAATQATLT